MNSRDFNARAIARALIDSRVHWGEKLTFYRWIRNFIYFPISLLFGQDDLHKSHRLWQEWRLPFVSNENFLEGTNILRFFFWKISPPFARFTLLFRRNISCFCLFWLFSSLNENVAHNTHRANSRELILKINTRGFARFVEIFPTYAHWKQ
jgi:hypothetical protein